MRPSSRGKNRVLLGRCIHGVNFRRRKWQLPKQEGIFAGPKSPLVDQEDWSLELDLFNSIFVQSLKRVERVLSTSKWQQDVGGLQPNQCQSWLSDHPQRGGFPLLKKRTSSDPRRQTIWRLIAGLWIGSTSTNTMAE